MIFAGVDPGSGSYEVAFVDELGRVIKYFNILSDLVRLEYYKLIQEIKKYRPNTVAMPSGHGLPFVKSSEINDKEIFLLTLADPEKEGHLRNFLRASKFLLPNAYTVPGVIELESVKKYKKINVIDMGTADKVASAFFYRTIYDSFVLFEVGTNFSSIIVVRDGKIIDGFGGTIIPGHSSAGFIDGEVAYLLFKHSKITKETIYTNGCWERGIEIARIIAEWYSSKYDLPIIVSGKRKDEVDFGIKFSFPYKESSVGSAYIANALGGGIYRKYLDFLKSSGTPIDYVRLKGWEEIISLIKTL
ncbi:MAG: DUF1464 family protein [Sulfolobus sp.]